MARSSPVLSRRSVLTGLGLSAAALVAGCDTKSLALFDGGPTTPAGAPSSGDVIGTGTVKVAMILPLSAGGLSARTAEELKNSAALALRDYPNANVQLLVKDDGGTTEGGQAAAQAAVAEGAQLIIGPVFGLSVRGAAGPARQAGIPIVAFSTDTSVASRGVYLFGFLPTQDIERVVVYAAQQGRKSLAAIVPDTAYGTVVDAALRQSATLAGSRIVAIERYRAVDDIPARAQAIARIATQIDAVLVPDAPQVAGEVVRALGSAGVDLRRVKVLGSGQWDDPSLAGVTALAGAWYPAPDQIGIVAFKQKYRAAYGSEPGRIAPLGYEAVVLAAGLVRHAGAQPFKDEVLLSRNGFLGAVSVFRFNPDGTNQRGLAVYEVAPGAQKVVSPAPTTFAAGS